MTGGLAVGADIASNAHAPDESYSIALARKAALAFLRMLDNVARLSPRG